MSVQVLLVLQVLVLPLALSLVAWRYSLKFNGLIMPALFLIWAVCYFWIDGIPSIPPAEAIEWVSLLGLLFVLIYYFVQAEIVHHVVVSLILLTASIVLLTWPVITHSTDPQLFFEIAVFIAAGVFILFRLSRSDPSSPALTLGITQTGLAIVSGIGGSLLIGQLSGVLASALAFFIFFELYKKFTESLMEVRATSLMLIMSLWLMLIARIYAEIPLGPTVMLLLSLLLGLSTRWRYASGFSLSATVASLVWLLLTNDDSSYY